MDIDSYIAKSQQKAETVAQRVRNFRVFDLSYIPKEPLIRSEARRIIDALVGFQKTGIPRNLILIGARGSGKTMTVNYLLRLFSSKHNLSSQYVNCRFDNTSFKILARILGLRPRGYAYGELCERFEQEVPSNTVVVLDEADLISNEKDVRKDILYFLSRSSKSYMLILLSNNPRFMDSLDESTRSSLQAEPLCFKNYSAGEINAILSDRASEGLKTAERPLLAEISALTAKNTNSDVRVALKTLLYCVTDDARSVSKCFERARRDIVADMLQSLNDKALLILRACVEDPSHLVRSVYKRYKELSRAQGEEPYGYVHFYNNLGFLQSIGLITLVSAKVNRAYTNRVHPTFAHDTLRCALEQRFN